MAELALDRTRSKAITRRRLLNRRLRWLRREGPGLVLLVFLTVAMIGPMSSMILSAFAGRWFYPAIIPTEFTLRYWPETFRRADIAQALPTSIALSLIVTTCSAVICLPAAYAFARLRIPG